MKATFMKTSLKRQGRSAHAISPTALGLGFVSDTVRIFVTQGLCAAQGETRIAQDPTRTGPRR